MDSTEGLLTLDEGDWIHLLYSKDLKTDNEDQERGESAWVRFLASWCVGVCVSVCVCVCVREREDIGYVRINRKKMLILLQR